MSLFGGIPAIIAVAGQTITLQRVTVAVSDDIGGLTRTWDTETADIACWVQPASSMTIQQYGARDIVITHAVYFSSDPGAQLRDRFLFGTRHLLVAGIENTGEVSKLFVVYCEETD